MITITDVEPQRTNSAVLCILCSFKSIMAKTTISYMAKPSLFGKVILRKDKTQGLQCQTPLKVREGGKKGRDREKKWEGKKKGNNDRNSGN